MSSLNKKYLLYLSKHPLLTKSVTAAVLASLNEIIALIIAKEFTVNKVKLPLAKRSFGIINPYNIKIPLLALFAFLVQAPLGHYAYQLLNGIKYFNKRPLPLIRKLLQIGLSLSTITPLVCALNVSFLGLVNNPSIIKGLESFSLKGFPEVVEKPQLASKLQYGWLIIKASLNKNLLSFLKSSWVSSPLIMFFAQTYLDPNSWVVFFNFAYFVLGTFQNTLLKLKLREKKKKDDLKREAEEGREVEKLDEN